jgi:hypothetical protein
MMASGSARRITTGTRSKRTRTAREARARAGVPAGLRDDQGHASAQGGQKRRFLGVPLRPLAVLGHPQHDPVGGLDREAKVLLNVRDPEQWYESMASTVYPASRSGLAAPQARC